MSDVKRFRNDMNEIGRSYTKAKIGGFRPAGDEKSWFGGNFLVPKNEHWQSDADGNMIPVIQIYVPDIPNGIELFGDFELIQVFLNNSNLPITPAKCGDGWLIKEYKSIDDLVSYTTPNDVANLKPFPIHWEMDNEVFDYPCWEEAWNYIDLNYVNDSEELSDMFFDDYASYSNTKIGGFASYIQSPISDEYKYIFQVSSEEKAKFIVADAGNLYFYKHEITGEWYMHWDCY